MQVQCNSGREGFSHTLDPLNSINFCSMRRLKGQFLAGNDNLEHMYAQMTEQQSHMKQSIKTLFKCYQQLSSDVRNFERPVSQRSRDNIRG